MFDYIDIKCSVLKMTELTTCVILSTLHNFIPHDIWFDAQI